MLKNVLKLNFGINFFTSFLFLLPTLIAYDNKDYEIALGSLLVAITGIIYHSTLNDTARMIDQIILTFCILYFMFTRICLNLEYTCSLLCVIVITLIYIFFSNSKKYNGTAWHSLIHLISCICIILLIRKTTNKIE